MDAIAAQAEMFDLPKPKGRLARGFEIFREFKELTDKEGMLVSNKLASEILGVSPQRISQLADEGKIRRVAFRGQSFFTEDSIIAWAKSVPEQLNLPKSYRECWTRARAAARFEAKKTS